MLIKRRFADVQICGCANDTNKSEIEIPNSEILIKQSACKILHARIAGYGYHVMAQA